MAVPLVPLLWVLFLVIRALRGGVRVRPVQLVAGFLRLVLFGFSMGVAATAWEQRSAGLLALGVAGIVPPFWWPMLLLQLGVYRASAVAATCVSPLLWTARTRQQAGFFFALGSLGSPQGWFARRARAAALEGPQGGAGLAGHALLALQGGQLDTARTLFTLVASLSPNLAPRYLRAYCQHFVLADAALRGSWYEVGERCRRGPWTPTAAVFAHAAALRRGQDSSWRRLGAGCGWLWMPHRVWGFRLLSWARQRDPSDRALPGSRAPLSERLSALTRLETAPPGSIPAEQLRQLARLVKSLSHDSGTFEPLRLRCAELGVQNTPEEILEQLAAEIEESLICHLGRAWVGEQELGVEAPALREARFRLLDELERLRDVLCDRQDPARRVHGVDLWLLWGKLRAKVDLYWALASEDRDVAFEALATALINLSAQLWNDENERALAHEICHFLYRHRRYCRVDSDRKLIAGNRKVTRHV